MYGLDGITVEGMALLDVAWPVTPYCRIHVDVTLSDFAVDFERPGGSERPTPVWHPENHCRHSPREV